MSGRRIDRRKFLAMSSAAAGALAAPAFIRAQTRSSAPIRIGVNLPLSGVFALVGQEANKGMEMYLESIKYTVAGRRIEAFFEDETVQVSTGVAKARKLIENDRVHALIGGASTPVIYATTPVVVKAELPFVVAVGGGAEITRKSKRNDYTFRTSYNIWTMTYPFAKWVAQNRAKKVYLFNPDNAAGKEYAEAFRAGFTEAGGQIVGESMAPLASPDFVPFLTRIAESKPEGIFGFWAANAAIRYLKAADQLGLNRTSKLFLPGFAVDNDTLPETGNAAIGSITVHVWNLDLPNAPNQALVKAYQAKYKTQPSYLPVWGWDAMRAMVAAVEKVKGNVEDKARFAAAFKGLTFDGPRGRTLIDAKTHDIVQDLYVREAVAGGRSLPVTKVIATLPKAADPFPDRG
jgi:branched-chain amino acid transport system substrate-binding protein